MYTSTNIANQTCLRLLKRFSLFLYCCILAFTSPLCVRASEPTATPGGSSSGGDYVTIEVPLAWTLNRHINLETGEEILDDQSGSVSNFVNIIPEASYSITFAGDGVGYTSGCISFYYNSYGDFISYQSLWNMQTGSRVVSLKLPAGSSQFRLATDMIATGDYQQGLVNLSITLEATYLEEHNLTEEAVLDMVYRDDSTVINDAADKFTDEYNVLHDQEDYLLKESKSAFDSFFASFSWSDLAEYSSGFQFIGTWFSNFYNSHSAVAVSVGMASGLVILFILLRFRGS